MDGVGDGWSEVADTWSRYWAPVAAPAQRALLRGIGPGERVLDVGCGSGELLALIESTGASAAGCDPSGGMLDLARARCPGADIRLAGWQSLPWSDDAFDLVTAVNALQFADDIDAALAEAARVGRRVGVANWADDEHNDLTVLERALAGDDYQPGDESRRDGYLSALLSAAGLTVELESIVETPMELSDDTALTAAFTDDPELVPTLLAAAAPFRTSDGGYLLRNSFRYATGAR